MRAMLVAMAVSALLVGCKKDQSDAGDAPAAESQPTPTPTDTPPPAPTGAVVMDAAPAVPEPTTPEELELALKSAMVEGRDQDVLAYCEKSGIDAGKVDAQTALGCTLSACRLTQQDKARAWSKSLPKELKKQAVQICMANKVTL